MTDRPESRVTQVMERPSLEGMGTAPVSVNEVTRLIEQGEEPKRIYLAIVECGASLAGITDCALFLPSEKPNQPREIIARKGSGTISAELGSIDPSGSEILHNAAPNLPKRIGNFSIFDVVCLGAAIGAIIVDSSKPITKEVAESLRTLAHHSAIVYERQKLSNTVQTFLDRLEVLNELNQLIAGNVGLQRIVKSIARESAFRFAADVTIAWLLDDNKQFLEPRGGYGCNPSLLPPKVALNSGLLGEVMRLGGNVYLPNLSAHPGHELEFLEELGIGSVDVCCLEVRGEAHGAILIGYKRNEGLTSDDLTRFEEFCQGAAVAISNARTQEKITAYTERLEELVESRTADLAVQSARAEEANRAKSRFLANMSHELRTPLTAIVGYSSVLADGIFGELTDKQKDALGAITRSSDHLKNLIDDVLNLARIESGKEHAEPSRVVAKDLLSQAFKIMLQTAVGKGVQLQPIELPPEMADAAMWVDQKHVQQILINLMGNAVKYTPRGGKVWLSVDRIVDKIKISVHDSGVGIPRHKMEKLFERFERGEDAYSKSQEGTGIGLNLTKTLVELNGGRIGVESQEGKGSIFWVLMPSATEERIAEPRLVTSEEKARLDGLSTLVIDDNQDTCNVLKQILLASGATVRTANTVQEGLALFGDSVPDIVLTDLAIPGESGLVLINQIRKGSGPESRVPIIVLSACAFQSDKEAALNAGASIFIAKPFRPGDVVKTVRNLTLSSAMQGKQFVMAKEPNKP